MIGYAIESAIDDTYAKGNKQEGYVNECKSELVKKCKALYKDANSIFNFDVNFREMGSSGNVFIYMSGTACTSKNKEAEKAYLERKLVSLNQIYNELVCEVDKYEDNFSKFPKSWDEVKKLIP